MVLFTRDCLIFNGATALKSEKRNRVEKKGNQVEKRRIPCAPFRKTVLYIENFQFVWSGTHTQRHLELT